MTTKKFVDMTEALAMPKTQYMYINAFEILGEHVAVRTTHGEIMDTIAHTETQSMDDNKDIYRNIITTLRHQAFDKEKFNKMYENNDNNWQNFCDDVVLAYCVRYVLHDKPIPAIGNINDNEFGERLDNRSTK